MLRSARRAVRTAAFPVCSARVAHLTLGACVRLVSQPNVSCKSYTRNIGLLVFLMVLTFALDIAAQGRTGKQLSEPEH